MPQLERPLHIALKGRRERLCGLEHDTAGHAWGLSSAPPPTPPRLAQLN
jgi:hypothetical protein